MEYLCHRVLRQAYVASELPVVLTGLAVGSRRKGREAISIDLSAYGDPLYMRYTRCAFSLYRKTRGSNGFLACLPRTDSPLEDLLSVRVSPDLAADYAASTGAAIPDGTQGAKRLLQAYLGSDLRRYHQFFDSIGQDEPALWPATYDRFNLNSVPPCVSYPLRCPNPALADPTNIQNVSRVLVSRGWHPRSVAGLIRSRFERDFSWGPNWLYYDAAARADFYVRLHGGLVADGLDDLRDFNCISHQEKGYCPKPWCGFSLGSYKTGLEIASKI
ncbi:MAG: hypothetical protein HYY32_04060 [Chloroflexi bacterium]|nr:hypothetical protein [Chloroflexota bacterium]